MDHWEVVLQGVITGSADPVVTPQDLLRQNPSAADSTAVLEGLRASSSLSQFVTALFPNGVPTNGEFFNRLSDFRRGLGFGLPQGEILSVLASAAVGTLELSDRQLILLGIADDVPNDTGLRLEILPQIVRDHEFPIALLAAILPLAAGKQYQGHNGYDRAVNALVESKPDAAFALTEKLLNSGNVERNRDTAKYLWGLLRASQNSNQLASQVAALDQRLSQSPHERDRILYLRSLIPTTFQIGLSRENFDILRSAHSSGELEESIVAFDVLAHVTWFKTNQESMFYALADWFEEKLSPDVPERCKAATIFLIGNAAFWGKGAVANSLERLARLWIKILPVDASNTPYWEGVDSVLHELIEKNFTAFRAVFLELAKTEGKRLIEAIKDDKATRNRMLLYSLHQSANRAELVHALLLCRNHGMRLVGLYLYDELHLPIIEKSRLDAESEETLLLLLLEMRLHFTSGDALARLLLSLLDQAERCSEEFRQELLQDLVLQGRDLPGMVLPVFQSVPSPSTLLQTALKKIETYFDDLKSAQGCPALGMAIAGYRKAAEMAAKRFSRQVTEIAEKSSIFSLMSSKMILLYGLSHSSYRNGKLEPAQKLQHMSNSHESSRIGVIAPENQAFRRLFAYSWIRKIEKGENNGR